MNRNSRRAKQHGFTVLQMVVTIAIIAIVSTVGVLGVKTARAEFRLQNSARLFASYVEKARADSVRRHAASGTEASIETFAPGTSTYAVTMDFGSGTVETRTFTLESGVIFYTAAKKVTFNWRGRITEAWVFQLLSQYLEKPLAVDVSGSGDITVGEQHFPDQMIPDVTISQVTDEADPTPNSTPAIQSSPSPDQTDPTPSPSPTTSPSTSPSPTVSPSPSPTNGNGNGNGGNNGNGNNGNGNASPTPTSTPTPSPSASASPSPTVAPCVSSISPNHLSLSQSDTTKQTGTATFTVTNGIGVRTISASQAGHGNSVNIGLSLVRIDGNGSSVISITTKNGSGNRGVFIVEISTSPACGSTQQLEVSVSN